MKDRNPDAPDNRLLYIPSHPERYMNTDLEATGIPKWTPEGKLDFHAARDGLRDVAAGVGGNGEGSTATRPVLHSFTDSEHLRQNPRRPTDGGCRAHGGEGVFGGKTC